ncbi:protein-L-isoaspartate(D-aspartate) O-methyltransferase [Streptomyces sp. 891-h]|uniref:protein-L-isoaspartate(D-aspartate) O-methyltransferase n=1 Tax=Streptomyces sp. 891-h TaxID=2720714 RepID=UPI001FA9D3DC|nr:protein-L-isoaspartate(D-aspartate) O-methyltransferase [Streptomyces sp. 891-h]UNZ21368.1 protein-L-isoaspartate(D-aspartate) O-methyltransferase [Streptomyces sp. 891-h]
MNASVAEAAETVPETYYTHHEGCGPTPHRSNAAVFHRELTTLDVALCMRVIERGTGSGYSGALLSHLVGPEGRVTSVDIDGHLTLWANVAHHDRGLSNIRCYEDGAQPTGLALFDRSVAWCTPERLPKTWGREVADNGLIITPLPVALVPNTTVVTKIRVKNDGPTVEAIFNGAYIEATNGPKTDLDAPGRRIDWDNRTAVSARLDDRRARRALEAALAAPLPSAEVPNPAPDSGLHCPKGAPSTAQRTGRAGLRPGPQPDDRAGGVAVPAAVQEQIDLLAAVDPEAGRLAQEAASRMYAPADEAESDADRQRRITTASATWCRLTTHYADLLAAQTQGSAA